MKARTPRQQRIILPGVCVALLFLAGTAYAQAPRQQQQQLSPELRAMVMALQQSGNSLDMLAQAHAREIAAKDARISELEKLCGESCKAKPEATPEK